MDVLHERCAGLDVHQASVFACVLTAVSGGKTRKEIRKFSTVRAGLIELRDWLVACGCSLVAMESTGVYWMPVYEVLEDSLKPLVANAHHVKHVPGRKTDVKDCEWIAELARHGLLMPSFVPSKPIRELRSLPRSRRKLVESNTTERNRALKVLEQGGVKLSTFLSDVFGASGRRMIEALLAGSTNPASIADLAKGKLRRKLPDIKAALEAKLNEEQRYLLGLHYERIKATEAQIAALDARIAQKTAPYRQELELLKTIAGIDEVVAPAVIGEVGVDVSSFPYDGAFASWVGLAPGHHKSAGKNKKVPTNPGNVFLKTMLVQAAWAAVKTRGYLQSKFYRLRTRLSPTEAIIAIAHKIAIAIYHVLKDRKPYRDLGADYLNKLVKASTAKRLVRRLTALGYQVTPPPAPPPSAAPTTPSRRTPRPYVLRSRTA